MFWTLDEFAHDFPHIKIAQDLLDCMETAPAFKSTTSSHDVLMFLARIDAANPNSVDISEDDNNTSWGHMQFTAGNLTCSSVLTSWASVGSCAIACNLLAAALKTCKIARHICFERNIKSSSYLSDVYLENVVEALWRLWTEAGGVRTAFPSSIS